MLIHTFKFINCYKMPINRFFRYSPNVIIVKHTIKQIDRFIWYYVIIHRDIHVVQTMYYTKYQGMPITFIIYTYTWSFVVDPQSKVTTLPRLTRLYNQVFLRIVSFAICSTNLSFIIHTIGKMLTKLNEKAKFSRSEDHIQM